MDPRNLYTLRYRQGFGVQSGLIVAANNHEADAVGKKWCNSQINCRFIKIEPAVIADSAILTDAEREALTPKKRETLADKVEPATGAVSDPRKTAGAASVAGGVPTAGKQKAS